MKEIVNFYWKEVMWNMTDVNDMTMEEKDNAIKVLNQIVSPENIVNYIKLIKTQNSRSCAYSWEIKVLMGNKQPTIEDIEKLEKLNEEMKAKFDVVVI
jgi:hypothetical protein